ncbi:MAG: hypothetical protein IJ542_01655 [Clostridia bacterium]|nr:hypothetical protein [Clostridia bacterium]
MENTFKTEISVGSQNLNCNEELSLQACMEIFQDVANTHAERLGADRWSLLKKSGAFWVVTKVKLKIEEMPKLHDNVVAETWTLDNSFVAFERDAKLSVSDRELVKIKSEWVTLDADTHKIRPAKTIAFPFEMENRTDRAIEGKFSVLKAEINKNNFSYSRIIKFGDLDMNNHVNNCYYSRFVLDCFSSEELKKNKIDEYEIHFVNECHEGEQLDFYKTELEDGTYVEARVGDKQIIKAHIVWKK